MKKFFSPLLLFSFSIMSSAFAQTDSCTEIKKENEYLRRALKIHAPSNKITSNKIDFQVLECVGSSEEQILTLTLLVTNHGANSELYFRKAVAVDLEGNEFKSSAIHLGSERARNKVYTDVPLKAVFTFKEVLPEVKFLKLIAMEFVGSSGGFEFKDIPVRWK